MISKKRHLQGRAVHVERNGEDSKSGEEMDKVVHAGDVTQARRWHAGESRRWNSALIDVKKH